MVEDHGIHANRSRKGLRALISSVESKVCDIPVASWTERATTGWLGYHVLVEGYPCPPLKVHLADAVY